jgi:hypothetical protein
MLATAEPDPHAVKHRRREALRFGDGEPGKFGEAG